MTFELSVFISVFAVAVGLFGIHIGSAGKEMRALRAADESRRSRRQPR